MALFKGKLAISQTACLSSQRKLTTAAAIPFISEVFCEHGEPVQAQREPGNPQPAFVAQMRTHQPHWWHQAGRRRQRKQQEGRIMKHKYNIQLGKWRSDLYTGYVGEMIRGFGAGAGECGNQVTKRKQGKDLVRGGNSEDANPKDAGDIMRGRSALLCYNKRIKQLPLPFMYSSCSISLWVFPMLSVLWSGRFFAFW